MKEGVGVFPHVLLSEEIDTVHLLGFFFKVFGRRDGLTSFNVDVSYVYVAYMCITQRPAWPSSVGRPPRCHEWGLPILKGQGVFNRDSVFSLFYGPSHVPGSHPQLSVWMVVVTPPLTSLPSILYFGGLLSCYKTFY